MLGRHTERSPRNRNCRRARDSYEYTDKLRVGLSPLRFVSSELWGEDQDCRSAMGIDRLIGNLAEIAEGFWIETQLLDLDAIHNVADLSSFNDLVAVTQENTIG